MSAFLPQTIRFKFNHQLLFLVRGTTQKSVSFHFKIVLLWDNFPSSSVWHFSLYSHKHFLHSLSICRDNNSPLAGSAREWSPFLTISSVSSPPSVLLGMIPCFLLLMTDVTLDTQYGHHLSTNTVSNSDTHSKKNCLYKSQKSLYYCWVVGVRMLLWWQTSLNWLVTRTWSAPCSAPLRSDTEWGHQATAHRYRSTGPTAGTSGNISWFMTT